MHAINAANGPALVADFVIVRPTFAVGKMVRRKGEGPWLALGGPRSGRSDWHCWSDQGDRTGWAVPLRCHGIHGDGSNPGLDPASILGRLSFSTSRSRETASHCLRLVTQHRGIHCECGHSADTIVSSTALIIASH